ncbi:ACT domain-containing protein [Vicingaceae bacterium]|nr:ACT domain-containing protein [Vicingaceae bacterium]
MTRLELIPGIHSVCKISAARTIPEWAQGPFVQLSISDDECTVVSLQENIPDGIEIESNWRLFRVAGVLDFSLVGIIAGISKCLADARISIFVASTFLTDYILVREESLDDAVDALQRADYDVSVS